MGFPKLKAEERPAPGGVRGSGAPRCSAESVPCPTLSSSCASPPPRPSPPLAAPPATLTGKVVSVHDGDTLTVLDAGTTQHKVRLHGIDAMEKKQAFGNVARDGLADQVFGKVVGVKAVDSDRYGRQVGKVFIGGRYVNAEMVWQGPGVRRLTNVASGGADFGCGYPAPPKESLDIVVPLVTGAPQSDNILPSRGSMPFTDLSDRVS
jgi:hypothetical protein